MAFSPLRHFATFSMYVPWRIGLKSGEKPLKWALKKNNLSLSPCSVVVVHVLVSYYIFSD